MEDKKTFMQEVMDDATSEILAIANKTNKSGRGLDVAVIASALVLLLKKYENKGLEGRIAFTTAYDILSSVEIKDKPLRWGEFGKELIKELGFENKLDPDILE
jgi:hypothetical protein